MVKSDTSVNLNLHFLILQPILNFYQNICLSLHVSFHKFIHWTISLSIKTCLSIVFFTYLPSYLSVDQSIFSTPDTTACWMKKKNSKAFFSSSCFLRPSAFSFLLKSNPDSENENNKKSFCMASCIVDWSDWWKKINKINQTHSSKFINTRTIQVISEQIWKDILLLSNHPKNTLF